MKTHNFHSYVLSFTQVEKIHFALSFFDFEPWKIGEILEDALYYTKWFGESMTEENNVIDKS